ncbi:hypothetical protein ABT095_03900 [Kitasatospora sp. NPDC002227]|uniref:hypothetical protein n=1 Tax=Kitasatospora sp. NPDC002227 TaxID=3154773 RepID=UPI0033293737
MRHMKLGGLVTGGYMSQGAVRGADGPSDWARRTFGEHARALVRTVPDRLAHAHERARASHLVARLDNHSPYGLTLAQAVLEEFAEAVTGLGGSVRVLGGRPYSILQGRALFPFRYANKPTPLGKARLRADVSQRKRRMLTAHSPEPDTLFPVEELTTTKEYKELHEAFEELGQQTTLVSVFYTSDVTHGVHAIHWGEAHLEPDRTFSWLHSESLPTAGG